MFSKFTTAKIQPKTERERNFCGVIAVLGENKYEKTWGKQSRRRGSGTHQQFFIEQSVDLMEFRQKDSQSTLFQCVDGLLVAPTTEEEYGQAIEAL